jgi:hypothetical protein
MLRTLAKSTGIIDRLRAAWRQDVHDATEPLRNEVRALRRDVDRLQATVQAVAARAASGDRTAAQLKSILLLDHEQRDRAAAADALLDERGIDAHVRRAIAAAPLDDDPFEHAIVEGLLPDALYRLLIETIPPLPFFTEHDPVKQDLPLPLDFGPGLAMRVWNFMDQVIAQRVLRPAIVDRFHGPLQRHYQVIFGEAFCDAANQLPRSSSGGRLMLRRPGYHLAPHRDPKRSLVTCLIYLARPGDSEVHGTQVFRVIGDAEAGYKQTYYPEQEGHRCELVKVVPFRPNSMLVFVNSRGAHGATIPADAPAGLERYAYQFYIAPENAALSALIKTLPAERRAMWANKSTR